MSPESVSVVIPCFNHADFLGEAIESVLSQTTPASEIVVIDDGSTDDSSRVAAGYRQVTCIRQENRGLSATRNRGLRESRGSHLIFLDADDRLVGEAIELSLRHFRDRPDLALVAGHCQHISADGSPLPTPPQPAGIEDHYLELLRDNFIWAIDTVMFSRRALEAVGGFDTGKRGAEDYDVYLRLAAKFPIFFHDQVVAEYRQRPTSMSGNAAMMLAESIGAVKSQREFVKGKTNYEEAYRRGLATVRAFYGDLVVASLPDKIKTHRWREALSGILALARFHPRALIRFLFSRAG